jgi:hypothetical protein
MVVTFGGYVLPFDVHSSEHHADIGLHVITSWTTPS